MDTAGDNRFHRTSSRMRAPAAAFCINGIHLATLSSALGAAA
jgi:hypothetical protein